MTKTLSKNTQRILGIIPCVLDLQQRDAAARAQAQIVASQVRVFGFPDQARTRTFTHGFHPEQELQIQAIDAKSAEQLDEVVGVGW